MDGQGQGQGQQRRTRRRAWCFTWNNYDGVPTLATFGQHARYLVYGHEVGANGTPHLQGYVSFDAPVDFSLLQRGIPEAHWEVARGTADQNRDYCTKDDNWVEEGELPRQGQRNDILSAVDSIRAGHALVRVAEEHPDIYIKYHRGLTSWKRITSAPRDWQMEIIVIVGPTGTGKSRAARQLSGHHKVGEELVENSVYWKPPGSWWDDYDGQHTVVWDEFSGQSYPFRQLLRILDSTPLLVEVKGSMVQFTSRRIIFTTNIEPEHWYDGESVSQPVWAENPLNRRLRESARILRTGEAHRARRPPEADEVAFADAELRRWIEFFENFRNGNQ